MSRAFPESAPFPPLDPYDDANQRLEAAVHPRDWTNPRPQPRYHLVVIGGGTAGLVTAAVAAGLGARTALVERALLGGDCLNVGCVPSKALLSAAHAAAQIREAADLGVQADAVRVDFPAVMRRMRELRAGIAPHDSAARFQGLGVDVFLGTATFAGADRIEVAGAGLHFQKAVIATGGRAAALDVPGAREAGCRTNETVFSLTELPPRLAVIGGGPIGCELAQAFARFGSRVTLLQRGARLLPRDDPEASEIVRQALLRDGVEVVTDAAVRRLDRTGNVRRIEYDAATRTRTLECDEVLCAMGRTPNVESLDLPTAGIEFDLRRGVIVDDRLRTTNPSVYAAGDVCSEAKFTHAADFMARLVVRNALFRGRGRFSRLVIPHCTYTSPEVAHVGLTAEAAERQGLSVRTLTVPLADIDRCRLAGRTEGFFRVRAAARGDRIVGATVVADGAGDLISEAALAMTHGLGLKALGSTIHPYPTVGEAWRKLGDRYNAGRVSPLVRRLLKLWFR
ncbi:MAG: mercuric reductase [Planctomyces sp.]|nr:mercuric reductase [Planctomyces sp.]